MHVGSPFRCQVLMICILGLSHAYPYVWSHYIKNLLYLIPTQIVLQWYFSLFSTTSVDIIMDDQPLYKVTFHCLSLKRDKAELTLYILTWTTASALAFQCLTENAGWDLDFHGCPYDTSDSLVSDASPVNHGQNWDDHPFVLILFTTTCKIPHLSLWFMSRNNKSLHTWLLLIQSLFDCGWQNKTTVLVMANYISYKKLSSKP